jgi:hypothetical protein
MRSNQAVSEIVGAILIFAIIVTAVGILYFKFMPVIVGEFDNLRYENAKDEIVELKELIERVRMGLEPSTTKFITIEGGRLTLNKSSFVIIVDGQTFDLGRLDLEVGSRMLTLETGVFEKGNSIPVYSPVVIKTPERIYIPLYNLSGSLSAGGNRYHLTLIFRGVESVEGVSQLVIRSQYCEAWKWTLNESQIPYMDNCPNSIIISSPGNITVSIYTIEVR